MGLFGKKDDGDDDSKRSALFSRSKKNKSPAPNPYAQRAPDAYTAAKLNAGIPQNGYALPNADARQGAGHGAPAADAKYSAGSGGYGNAGYGADRYGSQTGGNGASASTSSGASRYGPGGYGGMGGMNDSTSPDANRDALFGGAQERLQQKQQTGGGQAPPPYEQGEYGSNYGNYDSGRYGAYGDRQLTEEEQEEEDVQATKQEIKFMKQQDVGSTRNALRIAAQAEETGRSTLARLGAQGEMIHNAEKNLDLAANHNRVAEDKAKELKQLNKSMFAVHVSNPFTAKERRRQRDEDIINRHHDERAEREQTRLAAFQNNQRLERTFHNLDDQKPAAKKGTNLGERAKYQFEADSEDEEMENEIDSNLDALGGAAGRLNALAKATGKELEEQNKLLDRIAGKADRVDDQIAMNRARLDRFH